MRAVIIAIGLVAAIILCCDAMAHDHWINQEDLRDPLTGQWCCNTGDCFEEQTVTKVGADYLIGATGEVISHERVIWRSPGGWWRCKWATTGMTRCLIGPPNAT